MSTSVPPARTPASLAAQTQMGATFVDVPLDNSVPDKGTRVIGYVRNLSAGAFTLLIVLFLSQTLCHRFGLYKWQPRWSADR